MARPNDNRTAAGLWRGDTLTLHLEVREARWYPESDSGPFIDAPAFAQVGRAPQIPGPLIRVRESAMVPVTVRNALRDSSLTVHGLATRPASEADSIVLKPGETRELRFEAGAPETHHVGDHMAGLILGIHVAVPPGWVAPARGEAEEHRLRFINIGPAAPLRAKLTRNGEPVTWRGNYVLTLRGARRTPPIEFRIRVP